jgi:biopolymer transport protein ExbD
MAFSMNGSNGGTGFGRSRFRGTGTLSEINVVPLVDVVLVLLIIFMLTAHVMEFGMEIDVPKTKLARETAQELPVINVSREGEIFLNEKPVNINLIADTITQRFGKSKSVYLRADKQASWESIAVVIAELGNAKLAVNVVTQPVDEGAKRR